MVVDQENIVNGIERGVLLRWKRYGSIRDPTSRLRHCQIRAVRRPAVLEQVV